MVAWNAAVGQPTEGSNPSLSSIFLRGVMRNFLSLSLVFLFLASCNSHNQETTCDNPGQVQKSAFSEAAVPADTLNPYELRARYATVKVFTPGSGRGSGTYVIHKGRYLVITAAHVINDSERSFVWVVTPDGERKKAWIVYFDRAEDLAVLAVKKLDSILAMPLRVNRSLPEIGETLVYSGYPGHHDLLTLRGQVAGIEKISNGRTKITIHTYGWMGASGSGFFDQKGNMVGVLVALPIGRGYVPQLLEAIVFATPISLLDFDKLDENLCAEQGWLKPEWCPTNK